MRRLTAPALVCAMTSVWAQTDDWSMNNHWSFQGDFVYMDRNKLSHHVLVERREHHVLTAKEVFNEFEFTPGYRVSAGYMPDEKLTVELIYLDLKRWEGHHSVSGHNDLHFPFHDREFTIDFTHAIEAHAKYKSHYQEAELNSWFHWSPRREDYFSGSGLIGLRYMDLKEHFNLAFVNNEIPFTSIVLTTSPRESNYNITTKNRLCTLQFGLDLQLNPTRWWNWDLSVKAGPVWNFVTVKSFLGDFNNTEVIRDFEKHVSKVAFMVEPAATLTFQWGSHFNIHAGYQLTYVSGLALAGDQFDKGDSRSRKFINLNGDMIIQGGFAGLGIGF